MFSLMKLYKFLGGLANLLFAFLLFGAAEDGDKNTDAGDCAKGVDKDVAWVAVAARNEALMVFV